MSDNILRSKGRGSSYKFDRGGMPTEFGPYIGIVKNNIDPTRSGRLQVYIEQFAGNNPEDKSLWRTVMYVPPFYELLLETTQQRHREPVATKETNKVMVCGLLPPTLEYLLFVSLLLEIQIKVIILVAYLTRV